MLEVEGLGRGVQVLDGRSVTTPRFCFGGLGLAASKQREDLKSFKDFKLKTKARIWH